MKTAIVQTGDYRALLQREFLVRKAKNPAYSIRAFSRDLQVNKTTLAEVLAKKRHLSRASVLRVGQALDFTPRQMQIVLNSIRSAAPVTEESEANTDRFLQLQEDQFKVIADWYHFGILNLARIPQHCAEPKWIARALRISVPEVTVALDRLQRMGLLEIRGDRLVRTGLPVSTTDGIPSAPLRHYHRQNLKLAETSLEQDPVARRIFSSISVPTNPKGMRQAAELIQEFKVRFADLVERSQPKDVYTLAIQFFPVTVSTDLRSES